MRAPQITIWRTERIELWSFREKVEPNEHNFHTWEDEAEDRVRACGVFLIFPSLRMDVQNVCVYTPRLLNQRSRKQKGEKSRNDDEGEDAHLFTGSLLDCWQTGRRMLLFDILAGCAGHAKRSAPNRLLLLWITCRRLYFSVFYIIGSAFLVTVDHLLCFLPIHSRPLAASTLFWA